MSTAQTCDAEHAGYDGLFGVYCDLPAGHMGPHRDSVPDDPDSPYTVWWYWQKDEETA